MIILWWVFITYVSKVEVSMKGSSIKFLIYVGNSTTIKIQGYTKSKNTEEEMTFT